MKLQKDIVSVILPVYNAETHLAECLDSLKRQTYKNIQIIAIDDKSKDNSFKILKKFQKRMKNLKAFRNKKHYGLAICYNRAIKRASGQYITFMNANDINNQNRLRRQINFLLQNPKTVAVGTQYARINELSTRLSRSYLPQAHEEIYNTLLQTKAMQPETIMINRWLIPKDILHFTHNKYPFLFNEIFVKLFRYGSVANIAHALYYKRLGVKKHGRINSKSIHAVEMVKLWLKSSATHDYRPSLQSTISLAKRISLRSILSPLARGI